MSLIGKRLFWLILILIIVVSSTVIYSRFIKENDNMITGVVKYFDIEGGFYGIISDEGKNYFPINLSSEYKVDGLKIRFNYKEVKDYVNIYMGNPSWDFKYREKLNFKYIYQNIINIKLFIFGII